MKVVVINENKSSLINEGLMKKTKFNLNGKSRVDPDGNPEMFCNVGDIEIYLTYDETSRYPWAIVILVVGDSSLDDSGDMHTYELTSVWKDYESALDLANEVAKGIKPKDTPWDIKRKFMMFDMNRCD